MLKRFVVVGGGSIGRRHVGVIRAVVPDAHITLLSRSGQSHIAADHCCVRHDDAMMSNPQVAVIASTANLHLEDSLFFAAQKVHLLIEKPLSHLYKCNMPQIKALADLSKAQSLKIAVGYNLRYLDILTKLSVILKTKTYGPLLRCAVEASSHLPDWRRGVDYQQSASAIGAKGGGAVLELSHEIDYIQHLLGPLKLHFAGVFQRNDTLSAEDCVQALFTPVEDAQCPISLTLDLFRRDPVRQIVLTFEHVTLKADLIEKCLSIFDCQTSSQASWEILFSGEINVDMTYKLQLENLLLAIQSDVSPKVDLQAGVVALDMCEKIKTFSAMD